jgi:hypothetical protein
MAPYRGNSVIRCRLPDPIHRLYGSPHPEMSTFRRAHKSDRNVFKPFICCPFNPPLPDGSAAAASTAGLTATSRSGKSRIAPAKTSGNRVLITTFAFLLR